MDYTLHKNKRERAQKYWKDRVSPDFLPPIDLKKREESIERLEKFPPTYYSKMTKKLSPPTQQIGKTGQQNGMNKIINMKHRKESIDHLMSEDAFSDTDQEE